MIAARHHCPHCSAPIAIAVSSRIVGPEFVGLFAEFERRLRVLPSPFTSRQALAVATALTEGRGQPGAAWSLWSEFRLYVGAQRVRPGQRWVLPEQAGDAVSTPAASSTPTPPPTAIGPDGVPA